MSNNWAELRDYFQELGKERMRKRRLNKRRAATPAEVRAMQQVRGATYPNRRRDAPLIMDDLEDEDALEIADGECGHCGRESLVKVPEAALTVAGSVKVMCIWCDWARVNVVCQEWFNAQVRKRRKLMIWMTKKDLMP